ncbi:MAG: hypothetical protein HN368_18875, partial [Spirochaetales bacterium]|nr:hypothetical protein [Spirochaetales bacterium]
NRTWLAATLAFLCFGCTGLLETEKVVIDGVQNIHLHMDEESVLQLMESVTFKEETACLYEENGQIYNAVINVRGNISRAWDKKSFAISVLRADGVKDYALDASYFDRSSVRNSLAFFAYREIGIPAPQTENTALFLNGIYLGFYTKIEMYSADNLREFYNSEDVELFKSQFRAMGRNLPIQDISEKKIPRDDDYTSLAYLLIQTMSLSDSEWNTWASENFDVEQTARYLSIHNYFGVGDTAAKNFYIGLHDGRYILLPWDNEASLGVVRSDYYPVNGNNILTERLLAPGSPIREEYDRIMDEYFFLSDSLLSRIVDKVEELYGDIDTAIYYDSNRYWSYDAFRDERDFVLDYLNTRTNKIR